MASNLFPFSGILSLGNSQKSQGAMSGELGSRWTTGSHDLLTKPEPGEVCERLHCRDAEPTRESAVSLASCEKRRVSVASELNIVMLIPCLNFGHVFTVNNPFHVKKSALCSLWNASYALRSVLETSSAKISVSFPDHIHKLMSRHFWWCLPWSSDPFLPLEGDWWWQTSGVPSARWWGHEERIS